MSSSYPTNMGHGKDPFADLIGEMNVIYALTAATVKQLESGVFINSSGESLQMRKITSEMMKGNQSLIAEIHALALQGHLGFASHGNNNLRFRSDVAEKIGSTRNFQVFRDEQPEKSEHFRAHVQAVNEAEYSHLTEQHMNLEMPEEEKKKHSHSAAAAPHQHSGRSFEKRRNTLPEKQRLVRDFADATMQKHSEIKEKHRKHVAEARKEEAKREHEEVKRDTLKREIKNAEINKVERKGGEKRQELNTGDVVDVPALKRKGEPMAPAEKVKRRKLR